MRILTPPPQLQRPIPGGVRFPVRMVIPSDRANMPGLALPNEQWTRLKNGSIEVMFNSRDELEACLQATRAIRANQVEERE